MHVHENQARPCDWIGLIGPVMNIRRDTTVKKTGAKEKLKLMDYY